MSKTFTRLTACSALLAATALAGGALAGEEPFIATVCDDASQASAWGCDTPAGVTPGALAGFYYSAKEYQFTHTNTDIAYKPAGSAYAPFANGERFTSSQPINREDPCDVLPNIGFPSVNALYPGQNAGVIYPTNKSARIVRGNAGIYEWTIVLPKKLKTNLNIQIQCAVLKNQEIDVTDCAGEAGEVQGPGRCTNTDIQPGQSTIRATALPQVTATAYPGYYSRIFPETTFTPFKLTAFKVPSTLAFTTGAGGAMTNSGSLQILDGSANARTPLKACFTENIYVKYPVTGQVNAAGETENDLEAGDFVTVRMALPRGHTMDVYCNAQSVRIASIGDPGTLLE